MLLRPGELSDAALDALDAAVVVVNDAGFAIKRNASAERWLPPGGSIGDLLPCSDASGVAVDWSAELAACDAGGGAEFASMRLADGAGGARLVDIRLTPLEHPHAAAVLVVEDVTERESLQRRLAASERMAAVGKLAAKVAHELNNPLDGILRYVGLAERACDGAGGERTRKYLDRIGDGVGRMAEIIAELLNYSRSAGRPSEAVPVRSLVDQAVDAMAPCLEAAGVTLVCDIDDGQFTPAPGELFQALCNLIKNAADAMDGGGRLTITVRVGQTIVVTVADTGPGVPAENVEDIFSPFFTTKAAGKGTGLGLSISREIARRAGGDVTVANRPGGGAVFTLTAAPVGAGVR